MILQPCPVFQWCCSKPPSRASWYFSQVFQMEVSLTFVTPGVDESDPWKSPWVCQKSHYNMYWICVIIIHVPTVWWLFHGHLGVYHISEPTPWSTTHSNQTPKISQVNNIHCPVKKYGHAVKLSEHGVVGYPRIPWSPFSRQTQRVDSFGVGSPWKSFSITKISPKIQGFLTPNYNKQQYKQSILMIHPSFSIHPAPPSPMGLEDPGHHGHRCSKALAPRGNSQASATHFSRSVARRTCCKARREVERNSRKPGRNGIWGWVKTLSPCSSHQNSWDLWM